MKVTVVLLSLVLCGAQAFLSPSAATGPVQVCSRPSALFLQVPRIELPIFITDKLDDLGLKNPNTMTLEQYQSYSGAVILGTLLFFVLPGALLTGLAEDIGRILAAVVSDFAVSALVGGGAAIYFSLQDSDIGTQVRNTGFRLWSKAQEWTGLETWRYNIPAQVANFMTAPPLDLLNPNDFNQKDYDGYAGAAIAGTLAFFLLPGALLTGATSCAGDFFMAAIADFGLSAVVGGGAFIFLALRDDELAVTVNQAGAKLLEIVDQVLTRTARLLPQSKTMVNSNGASKLGISKEATL